MAPKKAPPAPPSPEAREQVLTVIHTAAEPVTAKSLAAMLTEPHRLAEAALTPILEEYVAAGRLHVFLGKTAKGKPRYWDRDPRTISRTAVMEAMQRADAPLTAKDLARKLTAPIKFREGELTPLLNELVASGTLHAIPPASAKGGPRYWSRDVLEFGRREMLKAVQGKGPQSEASLKKAAKGLRDEQFRQALQSLVTAKNLWRYPPIGKSKELFGGTPPSPEPYLKEVGNQLTKIVAQLVAIDVPRDDLRRAVVQMIEAAGVPFTGTALPRSETPFAAAPVDLIALMRRIEPGAERGTLVGSRDLRRAAQLEKGQFDRAVLELARQGRLSLHRHDYPSSLSPTERDELVTDGHGTYYVGIALRQNAG